MNDSVQQLATRLSASDLDRIVLTRRSWHLQSMPDSGPSLRLGYLLNAEFEDRTRALDAAIAELDEEISRWSPDGVLVLLDTSFFIEHPQKIEDADIASLLPVREQPLRVIAPILILEELDRLKRSSNKDTRWRAAYTLAVVDRVVVDPRRPGTVRDEDFSAVANRTGGIPRGRVSIEVFFDRPGHARLPVPDDEIIDRARAVQTRSGRPVTFITYDTAQAMRARFVGLTTRKLDRQHE